MSRRGLQVKLDCLTYPERLVVLPLYFLFLATFFRASEEAWLVFGRLVTCLLWWVTCLVLLLLRLGFPSGFVWLWPLLLFLLAAFGLT